MRGEMSLTFFVPEAPPPLYTTVSIDYLFACTPDYRLFWTWWGGSRDKNIFGAAGGTVAACTHRLLFPSSVTGEGSKKHCCGVR